MSRDIQRAFALFFCLLIIAIAIAFRYSIEKLLPILPVYKTLSGDSGIAACLSAIFAIRKQEDRPRTADARRALMRYFRRLVASDSDVAVVLLAVSALAGSLGGIFAP